MSSRDEVLGRIRSSLHNGVSPAATEIVRAYSTVGAHPPGHEALVDLFEGRLLDYKAKVRRTTPSGVAAEVAAVLAEQVTSAAKLIVPAGIESTWVGDAATPVDDGKLTPAQLDEAAGVLTACAVAIAETGTIVLDGSPDQGRRAISLVPDLHLCVVRVAQIVEDVPDALRLLDPTRPLTFISGGSATSDIELQRVEGVHGPRRLVVLIVTA